MAQKDPGHHLSIKGDGLSGHKYLICLDGMQLAATSLTLEMTSHGMNVATLKVLVNSIDAGVDVEGVTDGAN